MDRATYEIVTPYSEAMLSDIDYVQGADTMFLAHPDVPIHRLRRLDHDNWILAPAPSSPSRLRKLATGRQQRSRSSAAVGSGRTLTAGAAAFIDADVGRGWAGAGIATITGYKRNGGHSHDYQRLRKHVDCGRHLDDHRIPAGRHNAVTRRASRRDDHTDREIDNHEHGRGDEEHHRPFMGVNISDLHRAVAWLLDGQRCAVHRK